MLADLESLLNAEDGNTVLHLAAEKNMTDVVKYIVEEQHMNPNVVNGNNDTPLHVAVKKGAPELVEVLINGGANVNSMNRDGDNPIRIF
jgi:ankyrin repeat protein